MGKEERDWDCKKWIKKKKRSEDEIPGEKMQRRNAKRAKRGKFRTEKKISERR